VGDAKSEMLPAKHDTNFPHGSRKSKGESLHRKKSLSIMNTPSPNLFQAALAHHQAGRLSEAESLYQKILQAAPDHQAALHLSGVIALKTGKSEVAAERIGKAIRVAPSAHLYCDMGLALQAQGKLEEAITRYRRAISLKPDFADAHNNLGAALQAQGKLGEAAECYNKVISINPRYFEAYNNLGLVFQAQGNPYVAAECYHKALLIKPDFSEALINLGHTFRDLDELRQAAVIYQKSLDTDPDNSGVIAATYLAILHYLDGNIEHSRSKLLEAQFNTILADPMYQNARKYSLYLDKLLSWHGQFNNIPDSTRHMETLHVIGESHSLTAHGVVVGYMGKKLRCAANWIEGCKQWHLGNGKANKYKHKFEAVMERLPGNSVVLLTIGEIDCRHDEGIIQVCKKNPEKTLAEVMHSTVNAYLKYVAEIGARHGHRIIICGVPAPNISLEKLQASAAEQLVHLIRIFNASLKDMSRVIDLDFLDIYALTNRGDGIASGIWHIDDHHLIPDAMMEAFDRKLEIAASNS